MVAREGQVEIIIQSQQMATVASQSFGDYIRERYGHVMAELEKEQTRRGIPVIAEAHTEPVVEPDA